MNRRYNLLTSIAFLTVAALLNGCLTDGQTDSADAPDPDPSGNTAPTISGSPRTSTKVGESYSFTPSASDADGDSLTFSVERLPRWAEFEASDGTISGVPSNGDEGTYSNIRVSVSDGQAQASLPEFTVEVTQTGAGSATLSWTPPTENEDGSTLTDLAGYKIYYGVSEGSYPNQITVDNVGITTYVVENLSPDTYFFVSTAFNSSGVESDYSNVASKTIN